jgi:hypothetical protein
VIRRLLGEVALPALVTRGALVIVAVLAASVVPYGVDCRPCDLSGVPLLNALSRWDAEAYVRIAREGYVPYADPAAQSTGAFTPLLPMIMRGLAALGGRSDDDALLIAGLLASNMALVIGLAYLTELGRMELDPASARRAALYLLVFPTTILLSAVYAESLFLAFGTACLVEARRGRWWLAGGLAAFAALARVFGVFLVVPLAVERLAQHRAGRRIGVEVLAVAAAPLAFAAWQVYVWLAGAPLYVSSHGAYGRRATAPWEAITDLFDPTRYGDPWIVLASLALMTALVAVSWRVLRPSTAACATVMAVAAISTGTLTSFPRYALAIFPAFLVLGWLGERRLVHLSYLAVGCVMATVLTAMFAAWYWIG